MSPSANTGRLTAGDIMQTQVLTVSTTTPLAEVERLLNEHRISGVPVTDKAGHIAGVLSMRDLVERYAEDPNLHHPHTSNFYDVTAEEEMEDIESFEVPEEAEETAGDLMSGQVHDVSVSTPLARVAKKMTELRLHRILVEDGGKHVGLISTFDILRVLAGDQFGSKK